MQAESAVSNFTHRDTPLAGLSFVLTPASMEFHYCKPPIGLADLQERIEALTQNVQFCGDLHVALRDAALAVMKSHLNL